MWAIVVAPLAQTIFLHRLWGAHKMVQNSQLITANLVKQLFSLHHGQTHPPALFPQCCVPPFPHWMDIAGKAAMDPTITDRMATARTSFIVRAHSYVY